MLYIVHTCVDQKAYYLQYFYYLEFLVSRWKQNCAFTMHVNFHTANACSFRWYVSLLHCLMSRNIIKLSQKSSIITSESEIKLACSETVFGHRINTNNFHYLYSCTQ